MLVAGRYELHDVLGRGSMGTVYSGRDLVLDRPVALKLFPADATDDERAARYEREARLLARLSHPALVTVFDVGIDSVDGDAPKPYLVMQLVEGRTLAARLQSGPLPAAEVRSLALQLTSALAHMHSRGIVHRDIKPANILLSPAEGPDAAESATLTDFGIARLVDATRITMTGFTLGTANYLSPEQIAGADVTAASDIYSLGLVLFECLTGQMAFPGYGVEAALPRLQRSPEIPDSVPREWARLLRAMTARRPGARPTATEVSDALATSEPTPGAPAPTRVLAVAALAGRRATRRVPPAWMLVVAIAALIVTIVGLSVAAVSGDTQPPRMPIPSAPSVPHNVVQRQAPSPAGVAPAPATSVTHRPAPPPPKGHHGKQHGRHGHDD